MRQAIANPFSDRILSGAAPLGAIVAGGTLIFAGLVMLAEQAGLPRHIEFIMAGLLLVAGIALSAAQVRTMSPADWMTARRGASLTVSAMALAASLIAGWSLATLAGQFFAGSPFAIAWYAGPLLALAIGAFAIVPFLRKSGAATPAHLVTLRFASMPAGLAFAVVVLLSGMLLLWSQFMLAGQFSEMLFGIDRRAGVIGAALLAGLTVLPGGLRGMLRVNAIIFAFLATAYLAPLAWVAFGLGTLPVPQLSFGYGALNDIGEIERQLSQLGFARLAGQVDGLATSAHPLTAAIATTLFLAAGLCAMPFVLSHFSASRSPAASRVTAGWAILAVAMVASAAPALAAFAKLFLYRGILGLQAEDIPAGASWILEWGSRESILGVPAMAQLCGQVVRDAVQAIAACGGEPGYVIGPADIRLSGDALTLAAADIFSMPAIFSALIATAVLAGTIACANAAAFSVGANLSGALPRLESGRERQSIALLFHARLVLVGALAISAWFAIALERPALEVFMWAVAAGAGIIAPVFIGTLWWGRMNANGALAGLGAGSLALAVQGAMVWAADPGNASVPGLPVLPWLEGVSPAVSAAGCTLIVTLVAMVAASLATKPHDSATALDAMRRPEAQPLSPELEI